MFKRLVKKYKAELITTGIVFFIAANHMYCDVSTRKYCNAQIEKAMIAAATTETAPAEPTQEPPEKQYNSVEVIATAYCPCVQCCGKSDGITATGTRATEGRTIAADPNVFPYGTELIIDGVIYIVEDCGGAIKGNRIDIYFDTHEEALLFGRRTLTARVAV